MFNGQVALMPVMRHIISISGQTLPPFKIYDPRVAAWILNSHHPPAQLEFNHLVKSMDKENTLGAVGAAAGAAGATGGGGEYEGAGMDWTAQDAGGSDRVGAGES